MTSTESLRQNNQVSGLSGRVDQAVGKCSLGETRTATQQPILKPNSQPWDLGLTIPKIQMQRTEQNHKSQVTIPKATHPPPSGFPPFLMNLLN